MSEEESKEKPLQELEVDMVMKAINEAVRVLRPLDHEQASRVVRAVVELFALDVD